MPIEIPADTPSALVPLFWLIGRWEGAGVVGYPGMDEARFGQEIEFSHDGRAFLEYTSRTWFLDEDGQRLAVAATETGYWRVPGDPQEQRGAEGVDLEVLLSHPTGIAEMYLGTVTGPRIELRTDVVARTSTARAYSAATRMYGLVEGDLLWVMDMAAGDTPMTSHASARLKRV